MSQVYRTWLKQLNKEPKREIIKPHDIHHRKLVHMLVPESWIKPKPITMYGSSHYTKPIQ